jgi:ferredoxin
MKTEIFYFTGTGNSLAVARDIAEKTGAALTPISSLLKKEKFVTDSDMIGIIYPDYHSGIPLIVRRFAAKMYDLDGKYIYGICTYGGSGPGYSVKYLKKEIEAAGGKLSAGFAVKMPYNYIEPEFSFNKNDRGFKLKEVELKEQNKMFSEWKKKLHLVSEYINSRKEGLYETSGEMLIKFVDRFKLRDKLGKSVWLKAAGVKDDKKLTFWESINLMDHGFRTDQNCTGCRRCEKICPVNNIEMSEGGPKWLHHCEQCFACLHWCPGRSIQFGKSSIQRKRYHHPDIGISNMLI